MEIKIERALFDALSAEDVGHVCFMPMVPVYQNVMRRSYGRDAHEQRALFYQSLLPGQRALLMFYSYYDHAIKSVEGFQRISLDYLAAKIFAPVKKSAEYFGDGDMLRLLTAIEQTLPSGGQNEISGLYERLQEISPRAITKIGNRVKENPAEFVCLS